MRKLRLALRYDVRDISKFRSMTEHSVASIKSQAVRWELPVDLAKILELALPR